MATQNNSWLKKYWKDLIKLILILAALLFAVLGYHFSDAADTKFWWNFWYWLAIACGLLWLIVWVILWTRNKPRK